MQGNSISKQFYLKFPVSVKAILCISKNKPYWINYLLNSAWIGIILIVNGLNQYEFFFMIPIYLIIYIYTYKYKKRMDTLYRQTLLQLFLGFTGHLEHSLKRNLLKRLLQLCLTGIHVECNEFILKMTIILRINRYKI